MSRAETARATMIAAAERIVAERGLASMTLTAVQASAGQSNKSAASYHFGDRHGLISAVLETRMAPVNERRWQMLQEYDALPEPMTLRDIARAHVLPLAAATLGRPDSCWARFLAQVAIDPIHSERIPEHLRADSFREIFRRFRDLSDLPDDLTDLRFGSMVSLSIVTLATWESRPRDAVPDVVITDLIDTCTAVLAAPHSTTAAPPLNARK